MKAILRNALKNRLIWKAVEKPFKMLQTFYQFLEKSRNWTPELAEFWERHQQKKSVEKKKQCTRDEEFVKKWNPMVPENMVRNGPFSGMIYNPPYSICSSFYPKLFGTYEKELWGIMNYVCKQIYSSIIVVGCAEGYYAVGLAIKHPIAKVYAYDTDQVALNFCEEMAKTNRVNIHLSGFCEQETILQLELGPRAFIILDCEGYEAELINKDFVSQLASHDFLIEVHEMKLNVGLLDELIKAFDGTHEVEVIKTVADIDKVREYKFPELEVFDHLDRLKILAEERPSPMRWIFAKSLENF